MKERGAEGREGRPETARKLGSSIKWLLMLGAAHGHAEHGMVHAHRRQESIGVTVLLYQQVKHGVHKFHTSYHVSHQ